MGNFAHEYLQRSALRSVPHPVRLVDRKTDRLIVVHVHQLFIYTSLNNYNAHEITVAAGRITIDCGVEVDFTIKSR